MSFKIGLFSLKPGVGCTALSIHIANFIASTQQVALIEKTGHNETPEFHRTKNKMEPDGTFIANNVHFYPEQRISNNTTWPLEYEPLQVPVEENVQVYDFGTVNFMFDFPEHIDKLYLVTDSDESNIASILSFRNDLVAQSGISEFDVIVTGASRESAMIYKEHLPFASVISVTNKKEPRIDYMFAMKIQFVLKGSDVVVPEYHSNWNYDRVEFYSKDEWIAMWREKNQTKEASKKPSLFGKKPKRDEPEKKEVIVQESEIGVAKRKKTLEANVFESVSFESVPEPTFINTNQEPEIDEPKDDVPKERVMSVRPEPVLNDDFDEKAAIIEAAESFEPEDFDYDVSGEYKEHIVYAHKENEPGVLGDIIDGINRGGRLCCNLFLVTTSSQLFILTDMNVFFDKLEKLKAEIGDTKNIRYAVLTFNNPDREPRVFSEDESITNDVYKSHLALLDNDLRTKREFGDEDIKRHKELTMFDEVIYA